MRLRSPAILVARIRLPSPRPQHRLPIPERVPKSAVGRCPPRPSGCVGETTLGLRHPRRTPERCQNDLHLEPLAPHGPLSCRLLFSLSPCCIDEVKSLTPLVPTFSAPSKYSTAPSWVRSDPIPSPLLKPSWAAADSSASPGLPTPSKTLRKSSWRSPREPPHCAGIVAHHETTPHPMGRWRPEHIVQNTLGKAHEIR